MRRPSVEALPQIARDVARAFAERMASGGHRAWLVGGVVRDLARGLAPLDLDFASAATPDEVQALFPRAVGVGRRFGTLVVPFEGLDVEHTTFRTEGDYTDGRRPDRLAFGTSLDEDAARRDFTCNALYLDPSTDEVRDPTGGLADLEARRLVAVGDAEARFREDGLRLLRLARFAARLDLEPAPSTLDGARAAAGALANLSAERVLGEWQRIAEGQRAERALALLSSAGLLRGALPGLGDVADAELDARARVAAELAADGPPGAAALLAALHDPGPPWDEAATERALRALDALKVSRALRRAVAGRYTTLAALCASEGESGWQRTARRRALLAGPDVDGRVAYARVRSRLRGAPAADEVAALDELHRTTPPSERDPAPLVTADDLVEFGMRPGPALGQLLHDVRRRQLGGALADRASALAYARAAVARA